MNFIRHWRARCLACDWCEDATDAEDARDKVLAHEKEKHGGKLAAIFGYSQEPVVAQGEQDP
jgi:hypothetical protein